MNYFERVKKRLDEATLENSILYYNEINGITVSLSMLYYKNKQIPLNKCEVEVLHLLATDVMKRLEKEYEDGYFDDL